MENLPDDPKEVIDAIAKTKILKVKNESGSISLESHNQVNIQPSGTPFGAKLKLETDGSITPTITFDSKKMREEIKKTEPSQSIDNALEEYFKNENN